MDSLDDIGIPGTRIEAGSSEYGITHADSGTASSPESSGETGNQLVGPIAPEKIPAFVFFLAGYLDD